eukprot:4268096-Lingulodinium_polyedra.AAC.1
MHARSARARLGARARSLAQSRARLRARSQARAAVEWNGSRRCATRYSVARYEAMPRWRDYGIAQT